jgi:hypothetical protein
VPWDELPDWCRRHLGAEPVEVLFEAQNLRWHGREVWAVHDWDSLAWQPEAALVGSASGAFASSGQPTLAPVESSMAFLESYQAVRGRQFTAVEWEVAWIAGCVVEWW